MQVELEENFDEWRDYQNTKSLSDSQRRMKLASWADHAWAMLQTHSTSIRKCFDATCLIAKDGSHKLHMKRLNRPYQPISSEARDAIEAHF